MAGATKHDGGKPRTDLLDTYALLEVAKVLEFGARKYAPWNWAKGIEFSRLQGATLRHLLAFQGGEDIDPESGLPHLAHAMCCLMFLLSMTQRHPELDDRCPTQAKPNPMELSDTDRRFLVPEPVVDDKTRTTREAQLEQLLLWAMGYDVNVKHIGTFDMYYSKEKPLGWRVPLQAKLRALGVLP